MITTISTLPPVPNRNDPGTFSDKADSFLGAMPTFVSQLNNFAAEVNTLSFKTACKCATTTNITLSGNQTIDGVLAASGDRVLVKNQTTASQNGIYIVGSSTWIRASDMDTNAEVAGSFVPITYGTSNGGKIYYTAFNATTDVLGTSPIVWNSLTEGSITGIGTLAAINGGTGISSYTAGDLLYASGSSSLQKLAIAATGNVLKSGTTPSWGKVALASDVSGTLPVANGGTGASTLTANSVLLGNGTSALQAVAPGNAGNVLTSTGGTWSSQTLSTGLNVEVKYANTSGSFTIPASRLKVTLVGGGGGSSQAPLGENYQQGTGGGGGGTVIKWFTGLTVGSTINYSVGAGGSAGGSSAGNGTSTTISSGTQSIATVTAAGGAGGNNSFRIAEGGTASGGDLNIPGSYALNNTGGSSLLSNQLINESVFLSGVNSYLGSARSGNGYGGGASAAAHIGSGVILAGAAGAGGVIIFEW